MALNTVLSNVNIILEFSNVVSTELNVFTVKKTNILYELEETVVCSFFLLRNIIRIKNMVIIREV